MTRTISLLVFSLFLFLAAAAQNVAIRDSVVVGIIDSLVVEEKIELSSSTDMALYAVGTKIERISPLALERGASLTLEQLLKSESSLYIKEYGRGMLSHLSVRGRSSAHTALLWNGIDISTPTMGQINLVQIPLYFFDKMTIHTGGGSTLYGNGAIGGAIELSTTPEWNNGVGGDLTLSAGSYSTLYSGGTFRYSSNSFTSRTSLLYSSSKNNYKFNNNTKPGHPRERLNNSAYYNSGIMQEFHKRFKKLSQLSFNLWYLNFNREIQPSIPLNDTPENYASILDRSFKGVIKYEGRVARVSYRIVGAVSEDREFYKEDIIAGTKYFGEVEAQYSVGTLTLKSGGTFQLALPKGNYFDLGVKERRGYLYTVARYLPPFAKETLILGAGIRVGEVTNGKVPPMPSIDFKWYPYRRGAHNLALRGSFSISSRVPTLNDRYWGGVSSYLLSESSTTVEGGVDFSRSGERFNLTLSTSLYSSAVENWIRWLPAGQVWRPQNVPHVTSKGIEAQLKVEGEWSRLGYRAAANYSYSSIVMDKGLWSEDPSIGQQLAFQPLHSFNSTLTIERDRVSLFTTISYTGRRSTLDIFDLLPSYTLTNIGGEYKGILWGNNFSIILSINNLFGVNYQNVKFYAMPPTNSLLTLRYFF
ncbi:MAG: TonB-dependent receptor plug domain-containing protein [Bacteroidales bacterium]